MRLFYHFQVTMVHLVSGICFLIAHVVNFMYNYETGSTGDTAWAGALIDLCDRKV